MNGCMDRVKPGLIVNSCLQLELRLKEVKRLDGSSNDQNCLSDLNRNLFKYAHVASERTEWVIRPTRLVKTISPQVLEA